MILMMKTASNNSSMMTLMATMTLLGSMNLALWQKKTDIWQTHCHLPQFLP